MHDTGSMACPTVESAVKVVDSDFANSIGSFCKHAYSNLSE